jgi:hypothetical protein
MIGVRSSYEGLAAQFPDAHWQMTKSSPLEGVSVITTDKLLVSFSDSPDRSDSGGYRWKAMWRPNEAEDHVRRFVGESIWRKVGVNLIDESYYLFWEGIRTYPEVRSLVSQSPKEVDKLLGGMLLGSLVISAEAHTQVLNVRNTRGIDEYNQNVRELSQSDHIVATIDEATVEYLATPARAN